VTAEKGALALVRRVFLHPGPPKTGTTYIQSLLYANREWLRGNGLLVVGSQAAHFNAANDLLGTTSRRGAKVPVGAWDAMAARVRRFDGDVVMSCERYSLLRAAQVRRVAADLADCDLHLVLTLRDVATVLPARWQEGLKNGSGTSWTDFCEEMATRPNALRRVSRAHSSLQLWSALLPPEKVHVVTVPPSSAPRTLLLERFCEVLGLDPTALATLDAPRANPSLDLVGAEVVRRLNADHPGLSPQAHHEEVKAFLVGRVLAATPRGERPQLTEAAFTAAHAESARIADLVRARGLPVVGDLGDLTCARAPEPRAGAQRPDPEAVTAAAVAAVAALVARSARRSRRINALKRGRRDPTDGRPPRSYWSFLARGAARRIRAQLARRI
jgi:hypothetical protein